MKEVVLSDKELIISKGLLFVVIFFLTEMKQDPLCNVAVSKLVNDRNGQNQFRPKPKFRPCWPKVRPKFRPKKYQKLRENGGSFSIRKFFLRLGLLLNEIQIAWGNHFIFILLLAYEIIILLRELEKIAKNVNKLTWNLPKNSSKWRFLPFRYFGGFTERFGRNISANSTEISAEISVSVVHYR